MSVDVRVRIDDQQVLAAIARLRMALPETGDMRPAMRQLAQVLKSQAQMRFRAKRAPDGTEWKPSRRAEQEGGQTLSLSRLLRNSITAAHDARSATVGTNLQYAAIHQFGGVIRAKKGPFLAIPVSSLARAKGSPRGIEGLRVWTTLKGNYVMGTDDGTVHFLLRRQVTMPARPFLGVGDQDRPALLQVLQRHFEAVWKRA